jgi:alkanesulfonate monooxygenase SsuD/methylene tetrahydromethanopterin reductase-like flavin-dependent oxidoreductase (luciferase family)
MRYGIEIGAVGECGEPRRLAELARVAEESGWDGIFLEDYVVHWSGGPTYDQWVASAAMALNTKTIRLGTTVTPLGRRRLWKVASETVTLDHLCGGRRAGMGR